MINLKFILVFFWALQVARCTTEYDEFDLIIEEGLDADAVAAFLDTRRRDYGFMTCDELEKRPGSPERTCFKENSRGAFLGIVNDGAFMLGMGSSDVIYLIEIGPENKVVNIDLDDIHTFL
ncbi:MAG: hypothetical protein WD071_11570 [Pseudohongiella sp.]|uniref:hypothetical protein n=1 Tax=Pseudohongiella sp. TaxID=1979412 RepID=UPI0034A09558